MDLNSSETSSKKRKTSATAENRVPSGSSESTETFSELNLRCESEVLRDSVIAYLEDTFSENSKILAGKGFNTTIRDCAIDDNLPVTRQTGQREYEFSLEQSQRLFDRMQGFVELSIDETKVAMSGREVESETSENFCHSEQTLSLSSSSHEKTAASTSLFTKLAECIQHHSIVNVFVVVLQVNPVKELKIKSGLNFGQFVKVRKDSES